MGRSAALALVPLSNHEPKQLQEAADRLMAGGDEDLTSLFKSYCYLRYNNDLRRILVLTQRETIDLLLETPPGKAVLRKGREQGLVQGLVVSTRAVLKTRYPKLAAHPALDLISGEDRANQVLNAVLSAASGQALAAIVGPRNCSHEVKQGLHR